MTDVDEAMRLVISRSADCVARLKKFGINMVVDVEKGEDTVTFSVNLDSLGMLVVCEVVAGYLEGVVEEQHAREATGGRTLNIAPAVKGIQ